METIDNKTKIANRIFYTILILLILASVGVTFWKIVIQKDYQIVAEVSCDSTIEACYRYEPEPCVEGDSECIPEEAYDYKMISKNAANIYACEQTEEKLGCDEELSCLEDELNCSYTNCIEAELGEDEACAVKSEEVIEPEIMNETNTEQTTSTEEITPEEI